MARKALGKWAEARRAEAFGYVPMSVAQRKANTEVWPGWKLLGSGASRTTYLAPSGTVYKVARAPWHDNNLKEYDNYLDMKMEGIIDNPPMGWAIPTFEMFTVNGKPVIATEYIPGKTMGVEYWAPGHVVEFFKLDDLHGNNIVAGIDGTYYIIDLGEYREN